MNFCTAINCIDGRVQKTVIDFITRQFGYDYIDMITHPGMVRHLSKSKDQFFLNNILETIRISLDKHNSRHIFVIGHHDCVGNPVERETQVKQIQKSIKRLHALYPAFIYSGIYVNSDWECELLDPK
jgi:carbonic anhydrase